jgi:hypothetical protein
VRQRLDRGRGRLLFENIAAPDFDPARYATTFEALMGRIPAILLDGRLVRGMEVLRRVYGAAGWDWRLAPTGWPWGLSRIRCSLPLVRAQSVEADRAGARMCGGPLRTLWQFVALHRRKSSLRVPVCTNAALHRKGDRL